MAVLTHDLLREGLQECLEGAVSEAMGRRMVPSGICWERCELESSYETYVVTLNFTERPNLRVFLKDYGSIRRPKGDLEARRERELFVYSDLLPAAGLDTARCYGSVWERSLGRYWLFLEFVEGTPLRYLDFEHWPRAAAWLGRVQGFFAQHPVKPEARDILLGHDNRFFTSTAERALRVVRETVPTVARGLEAILDRYDHLVGAMSSQPRTLVHGAYRPEQILVDLKTEPRRFCPVDWELAALGSGIYDLAFFADGFKGSRLDQVLDAYRETAVQHGAEVPSRDDLGYLVNCFRLHKVFNWLGQSVVRGYSADDVVKLTEMAKLIAEPLV